MDTSRIFQLLDAGYTKEEIEAFEKGLKDAEDENKPKEDKPLEKEETKPEENKPISDEAQAIIDNLNNQISELTKTIQSMNVKNRTFQNETKQTAEQVLNDIFGGK